MVVAIGEGLHGLVQTGSFIFDIARGSWDSYIGMPTGEVVYVVIVDSPTVGNVLELSVAADRLERVGVGYLVLQMLLAHFDHNPGTINPACYCNHQWSDCLIKILMAFNPLLRPVCSKKINICNNLFEKSKLRLHTL